MTNVVSFVDKYILEKSKAYKILAPNDAVYLYNNEYRVVKHISDKTILVDSKNYKFCIPTRSLMSLIRKGGMNDADLHKAKWFPVGTVNNGRKKIAEGVWVDVNKETFHANHEGSEAPKAGSGLDPELKKKYQKVVNQVQKIFDSDSGKITDKQKKSLISDMKKMFSKESEKVNMRKYTTEFRKDKGFNAKYQGNKLQQLSEETAKYSKKFKDNFDKLKKLAGK